MAGRIRSVLVLSLVNWSYKAADKKFIALFKGVLSSWENDSII
jgi:hypothetical protein